MLPTDIETNKHSGRTVMGMSHTDWIHYSSLHEPALHTQRTHQCFLCIFFAFCYFLYVFFCILIECKWKRLCTVRGWCDVWETLKLNPPWRWGKIRERKELGCMKPRRAFEPLSVSPGRVHLVLLSSSLGPSVKILFGHNFSLSKPILPFMCCSFF